MSARTPRVEPLDAISINPTIPQAEQDQLMREISLFRAFTLSMVLVITTIYVLYLNYLLLGQFFFCLFLAQITSTSLRPYCSAVIKYGTKAYQETDYILRHSYLYRIILEIGVFFRKLWDSGSFGAAI
jgi:hypothetical protein